ncbi:hypothetical protein ACRAWF_28440 [Streptomyces sp. L7]
MQRDAGRSSSVETTIEYDASSTRPAVRPPSPHRPPGHRAPALRVPAPASHASPRAAPSPRRTGRRTPCAPSAPWKSCAALTDRPPRARSRPSQYEPREEHSHAHRPVRGPARPAAGAEAVRNAP